MELPKHYQYCEHCDYGSHDMLNFHGHLTTQKHALNTGMMTVEEYEERRGRPKKPHIDKVREIKVTDGEISLIPNVEKNQTDSIFIAGPRGSGKSFFSADYIKDYLIKFPKNRFIMFSNKNEDEPLDKLSPIRMKLTEKIIEKPFELKDFKNSIVLFDDIDGISNKNIKKEVFRLYDTMLKDGRSFKITPLITYHNVTDYKATREMLNNSSHCVIFPKSGALAQNTYFLHNYCGLSKLQIKKVFKLDSRWVVVKKTAPMAIIYQKGIYLL
jgi:hypothetical protein